MKEVSIIGVDLAKQVFQLHGATAEGEVVFRKKVSRKQFLAFMQAHPRCRVAMEACATAHHWARTLMSLGHEVRLIAPKFVKPYVKNQKNDMADAEAIAEAASRPTMRFVEVKTPEQQGLGMIFRLRDLLVGQRTQTVNALRGHLAEFGVITAKGRENIDKLRSALERDEETADIPASVRHMAQLCFDQIDDLSRRITDLDAQMRRPADAHASQRDCRGCPALGLSPQWLWLPSLHRWKASGRGVTSRHGWALCPGSIRAVASRGLGARASPGSGTFGAC